MTRVGIEPRWGGRKNYAFTLSIAMPTDYLLFFALFSVFYRNNQSANVWTHFLPLLWFSYRYSVVIREFDNPFDPIHYPFYAHGMGKDDRFDW